MKTRIKRVVITLFIIATTIFGSTETFAQTLKLRPVVNVRLDKYSESPSLVPEYPIITRRLVAPSRVMADAKYLSFGVALFPEVDGSPIGLTKVKFRRVSFQIWIVRSDGTLDYTSFSGNGLASFGHESGTNGGFIFTTATRNSVVPNSPSGGNFINATVNDVAAIYLSRMPMNFGPFPRWDIPKEGEGYQMDFKFDLDVTYGGVTRRIVVDGDDGLTAKFLVSDKMPEIIGMKPAISGEPEVITTKGEDVRQYRMKWSDTLRPQADWPYVTPPPTVQILLGGIAEWTLPEMPSTAQRFYVLEWTPEPQFYVPQYPVYSPDTEVALEELAKRGNP